MSTETWVDAHQQYHVEVADDVFQYTDRCGWIQGDTSLHASGVNLLDGAMQMNASLIVHVHHHGANLGGLLDVSLRAFYHEVNVEGLGANLADGFQYWESKGNVGYEDTIHDIHVKPISLTLVDHVDVALQVNEVG